ncbi:MAG: class I tRNA ligase family protein [Candidatus Komeilibacteria bacterium]
MKSEYQPSEFEAKWQQQWQTAKMYQAEDFSAKAKKYILVEFPYPSGEGLHIGHCLSYVAQDLVARYHRMKGNNVLYPMGWDAFGLPAENYAIKNKIHPRQAVEANIANFQRQIQSLGISFDWSREINTTDPKYFKWTQWIFLQLFKAGLAEKKLTPINWCPSCKIGLAFEEVIDGKCERCGTEVEQRTINQWVLKITQYADRLIDDLETVNFLPHIKKQQIDWIGRSKGAEIDFEVRSREKGERRKGEDSVKVFTTRPDTIFGATFLVLAPEHGLIKELTLRQAQGGSKEKGEIQNWEEVENYIKATKKLTDRERQEKKEKTGVELKGIKAIHPLTKEELPIFIADYVMMGYGTGAIMAVPAHDQRDWDFAKKYDLPIKQVIAPHFIDPWAGLKPGKPSVKRKNIHVILRRPSDGKILMLDWHVNLTPQRPQLFSFVIGGAEEGEDYVATAKRELAEEAGYTQVKFIKQLEISLFTEYYAAHKDVNRWSDITVFSFELTGDEKLEVAAEELAKHTPVWVDESEVEKKLNIIDGLFVWHQYQTGGQAYTEPGLMMNSHEYDGLPNEKAGEAITADLVKAKKATAKTHYKLRDWIFSRQHYWGEPIPIIICPKCGYIPLEDKDLPLELPEVDHYEPTDTGESPLAKISGWVNVKCPKCGGPAKRETDTMPNWAGSSWYYLRYMDPNNDKVFADRKKLDYWQQVDIYNGGMEHTTLHLLYSRFWHKFLFDQKLVPTAEPYASRISQGMVLGPDSQKMSKSRGNVTNPDDIVAKYGADTLRIYEMFMGEYEASKIWNDDNVQGVYRFLKRIWDFGQKAKFTGPDDNRLNVLLQNSIKKMGDDIERRSFNTAVSQLMICFNELESQKEIKKEYWQTFLLLLAPLAPHLTEELWQQLGNKESIHLQKWPTADEKLLKTQKIILPIQINGKVRGQIEVEPTIAESDLKAQVLALPLVQKHLNGIEPKNFIYVSGKIVNIVLTR